MKKSYAWMMIAAALMLVIGVGSTVAYLVGRTPALTNSFTVGNVSITLTETTGGMYKLVPGAQLSKDPAVTVKAPSDACWLFVKVQKTADFDSFCTYSMAEGWLPLSDESGVFYREVDAVLQDTVFRILKNDRITVRDTVTEEMLGGITQDPNLTFYAYAVQREEIVDAHTAWQTVNS